MKTNSQGEVLERIHSALEAAVEILNRFTPGAIATEYKMGHDPVTEADRQVDRVLRQHLLRPGEGWLSEESVDDRTRLDKNTVWVVDPLDGTREFVAGIPEFCVSIAWVENHRPVAGGIANPATKEVFLGALGGGVTYNGKPAQASSTAELRNALVLASRSEVKRGEWEAFKNAPFKIQPTGSVAYKLARVAAGLADSTFTLTPKHEWDIAAGAALVVSGGGWVETLEGGELCLNQASTRVSGLIAGAPNLREPLSRWLDERARPTMRA